MISKLAMSTKKSTPSATNASSSKKNKAQPSPAAKKKVKAKRKLGTTTSDEENEEDSEEEADDDYKPSESKKRKSNEGNIAPEVKPSTSKNTLVAVVSASDKKVRAQRSPLAKARAASPIPITPISSRASRNSIGNKQVSWSFTAAVCFISSYKCQYHYRGRGNPRKANQLFLLFGN